MKKMKKILAMLLALTMVLGMTMIASAETTSNVPNESNTATVKVKNVEKDAVVTAYQVIGAKYNDNGFLGYVDVADIDSEKSELNLVAGTYMVESEILTSTQVAGIAKEIINKNVTLKSVTLTTTDTTDLATFSADLTAGYWIVLVSGTVEVYNPMLVGVYYTVGGSDSTLGSYPYDPENPDSTTNPGYTVDANAKWELVTTNAYAKSGNTSFGKSVNKATRNLGDVAEFAVTALIPDYSDAYEADKIKFHIIDSVQDNSLKIDTDSIKVYTELSDDAHLVEAANYEVKPLADGQGYTIMFNGKWIQGNPNKTVIVTYKAEVLGEIYAGDSHDNVAQLVYTSAPGEEKTLTAEESIYTFKIDGLIKKVKEDGETPLANAEFMLYTDAECTIPYVNEKYETGCVVKTGDDGLINIYGLDENIYYLKETKAPAGYSLNDTVYKIVIKATVSDSSAITPYELSTWTIQVENTENKEVKTSKYDVNKKTDENGKVISDIGFVANPTIIVNTKLIALPSTGGIGTTIFTIAGCGIMIAAAFFFFASRKKENE